MGTQEKVGEAAEAEWAAQRKIEEDRRAKDHADWDAEAQRLQAAKAAEAAEGAKTAAKPKRMNLEERMIKEREDKRASQALRCLALLLGE